MSHISSNNSQPPRPEAGFSLFRGPQIGILLLVAVWMFGLGVLAGRGTAPVRYDIPELSNKFEELMARVWQQEQTVSDAWQADEAADDFMFFEALQGETGPNGPDVILTEEKTWHDTVLASRPENGISVSATDAPVIQRSTSAPSAGGSEANIPQPSQSGAVTPVTPAEKPSPPAIDPQPRPETTSTSHPLPVKGPFSIQIAAFGEKQAAEDLVAILRERGYPAYQQQSAKDPGAYYRVRVGVFDDVAIANLVLNSLAQDNFIGKVVPH